MWVEFYAQSEVRKVPNNSCNCTWCNGIVGTRWVAAISLVFYQGELCRSGESVSLLALDLVPPPPSEMTKSLPDGPIERGAATLEMPQFRPSSPQKREGKYARFIPTIKTSKGYTKFCAQHKGVLKPFCSLLRPSFRPSF